MPPIDFSTNKAESSRGSQGVPTLSLILCSRNDSYMGNSRWRLQTALNFVARNIEELGREPDSEIIVADWGSDVPLRDVLALSPVAARMTSFVHVQPGTARELQRDSPFAEVIALNAAARRARGTYIGRIDQDTLVGIRFLRQFFERLHGRRQDPSAMAMGFANIRYIPYRFAVQCPSEASVTLFVNRFGKWLTPEHARSRAPFYNKAVGIWMVRRDVWDECGGYDERMIYMNTMEINMVQRLLPKYPIVNLGDECDCDFYHLEHYHPWVPRRSAIYRPVNTDPAFSTPSDTNPNGPDWGMKRYRLEVLPGRAQGHHTASNDAVALLSFAILLVRVSPAMVLDVVVLSARRRARWMQAMWQRARVHAISTWPRVALRRLRTRRTR